MHGAEGWFFGNSIGQVIGNKGLNGFNPAQAIAQAAIGGLGGAIGNVAGLAGELE
jgi:hypothetical protein